jgi:biotin carboxyl carrier protein
VHFDLEIGGRVRRVRVERQNAQYQVTVDDHIFLVDSRAVNRETLSLLVQDGDGSVRSVDATVQPRPGSSTLDVSVSGQTLSARLLTRSGARGAEGGASGSGPQQVLAPMPGKVVRVMVAPGDSVEPRQGLVVIEAMKMENELRAARAGRVKTVRAAEGQSVEAGALLVIVE